MEYFAHESADIGDGVFLGDNVKVWHYAQIREDATISDGCIIGRGAYIGSKVHLGENCKIQNYALVYEPAHLEAGVFVGPAAVLTNDQFPRSVLPDMSLKNGDDWEVVGVTIREGASIGARAVCIAPLVIGKWATIGAGAVVTKDVPDFALMLGVPARRAGWVGKNGHPLADLGEGIFECPVDRSLYRLTGIDLLEEIQ
jgi:acetyltransferase-like isoleucine patch superfamily enzyme